MKNGHLRPLERGCGLIKMWLNTQCKNKIVCFAVQDELDINHILILKSQRNSLQVLVYSKKIWMINIFEKSFNYFH